MSCPLSILIVTHSKPCLAVQQVLSYAMAADTPSGTEVLVYWSGCTLSSPTARPALDGAIEAALHEAHLRQRLGRILVLHDPANLGICKGFNALIHLAQGELLFFSNDDMIANTSGWFAPLADALAADPRRGIVCPQLINGGLNYSEAPQLTQEMLAQVTDFTARHTAAPHVPVTFVENETNQPWLVPKKLIPLFAEQDPILTQKLWICEWTDPSGVGWYVDWGCYQQVRLAGYTLGQAPQSVFYHYDHVTVRDKDKNEPGWAELPRQRYLQKWGTTEKLSRASPDVPEWRVVNDRLVRA